MRLTANLPRRSGVHAVVPGLTGTLSLVGAKIARVPHAVRAAQTRGRAFKTLNQLNDHIMEDVAVSRAHVVKALTRRAI